MTEESKKGGTDKKKTDREKIRKKDRKKDSHKTQKLNKQANKQRKQTTYTQKNQK